MMKIMISNDMICKRCYESLTIDQVPIIYTYGCKFEYKL